MQFLESPVPLRIGVAVAAAVAATLLTEAALPFLLPNVFVLFLLAILGSSLYGGLWPGLLATALSCVGAAVVVFEPRGEASIVSGLDMLRLATLALFGVVIAVLSQALRRARERAMQRELAARTGEESFRAIFDSTADAIYVTGALGRILNANRAASQLHGMKREELTSRTWQSLIDATMSDMALILRRAESAFAGEPQQYEAWVKHASGTSIQVEVKATRARYFGRDVLIGVARDQTERRRLEAELRQSQKMDAIGRLAGGVAHDFNNLLTTIRGYASLMRDRVGHDSSLLEDLGEIERAVDLATSVTRQLLAFSRKQEYLPRAISLNESLDRIESLLRRLIDERVELVVERDPRLGRTLLDEGQLEQVIMNLVVNARDALPENGGRIVVRTFDAADALDGEPAVAIAVTDNGVGMDEQTRARIFEPFFTTKEAGHGTGLGLSTVYAIVQQSGGSIDVDSAPGRGATFTIYFPRMADASQLPEPAVDEKAAASAPRERTVLLAEDEEPVRHLVRRVLMRRGYQVIEASNGREALDVARARKLDIDALVTDVIMPEMTGPELAEALRAEHPELPVLFTSGYNDQGMEGSGVVAGLGIAFLQKPFLPDELIQLLGELMDQRPAVRG